MKIHYALLHRDTSLLADRANPAAGTLDLPERLEEFGLAHALLQAIRGSTTWPEETHPASVLVFECQERPAKQGFDFLDNVGYPVLALRTGKFGLVGVLQDWRTLADSVDNVVMFHAAGQLVLHHEQFREVAAFAIYMTYLHTHTFPVILINPTQDSLHVAPVGAGGFPYHDVDETIWAQFQAYYLGVRVDDVLDDRGRVQSRVRDAAGNPYEMPHNATSLPPGAWTTP